jgi:hypothetical protein
MTAIWLLALPLHEQFFCRLPCCRCSVARHAALLRAGLRTATLDTLRGGTRQSAAIASRSLSSAARKSTPAIAFDIDGVLTLGKDPIPGARDALLRCLDSAIPFCVMTNGGGVMESVKAAQLSKWFDVPIAADQVVLSHTPMRSLVPKYKDERILVVGAQARRCWGGFFPTFLALQAGMTWRTLLRSTGFATYPHHWSSPPWWALRCAGRASALCTTAIALVKSRLPPVVLALSAAQPCSAHSRRDLEGKPVCDAGFGALTSRAVSLEPTRLLPCRLRSTRFLIWSIQQLTASTRAGTLLPWWWERAAAGWATAQLNKAGVAQVFSDPRDWYRDLQIVLDVLVGYIHAPHPDKWGKFFANLAYIWVFDCCTQVPAAAALFQQPGFHL